MKTLIYCVVALSIALAGSARAIKPRPIGGPPPSTASQPPASAPQSAAPSSVPASTGGIAQPTIRPALLSLNAEKVGLQADGSFVACARDIATAVTIAQGYFAVAGYMEYPVGAVAADAKGGCARVFPATQNGEKIPLPALPQPRVWPYPDSPDDPT